MAISLSPIKASERFPALLAADFSDWPNAVIPVFIVMQYFFALSRFG